MTDERAALARYDQFQHIRAHHESPGVLVLTLDRPEKRNAMTRDAHNEWSRIWPVVATDPATRAVVVTGAGSAFCAGGDFDMIEAQLGDFEATAEQVREAAEIVYGMINCPKPIISAINGVAVGAGLALALMADISIAAESALLGDGHVKLGLAAGDHAAIIWPLLCGMAKTKYYLLTAELVDGREAERIGLVSQCVEDQKVMSEALRVAQLLAGGHQHAIQWTKRSLNGWLRLSSPIFESSSALELLTFMGPDARAGLDAVRQAAQSKRDGSNSDG